MTNPPESENEPQELAPSEQPSSFTEQWYDPRIIGQEEKGAAGDWEQRG